jgi:hypothetical protein
MEAAVVNRGPLPLIVYNDDISSRPAHTDSR